MNSSTNINKTLLKIDNDQMKKPPVITIDGPGGVGKGTVSRWLADLLEWNFLDSGSLYRALVIYAEQTSCSLTNPYQLAKLAHHLPLQHKKFQSANKEIGQKSLWRIFLGQQDITELLPIETYGQQASKIAVYSQVRDALLQLQLNKRRLPGLVADGRDMGTIVFPDANLKFFLDATPEERAKRRYCQLKEQNVHVSLSDILRDVVERDFRDRTREVAPLRPADNAIVIDTTHLTAQDVFNVVKKQAHLTLTATQR